MYHQPPPLGKLSAEQESAVEEAKIKLHQMTKVILLMVIMHISISVFFLIYEILVVPSSTS